MDTLNLYAAGAVALIGLIFVLVRRIPVYVILCPLVIAVFIWTTHPLLEGSRVAEWTVMIAGLALLSFGLLIVRVMLIRSVSLQLLGRFQRALSEGMTEDIGGRLRDMEYFRLIRRGDANRLTPFGRFCAGVVVIFYTIFHIK